MTGFFETNCSTRDKDEGYWGRERRGAGTTPACSNLDDTLHYYVPADILTEACGTRWRGGTHHHSHPPLVLCRGPVRRNLWVGKKTKG